MPNIKFLAVLLFSLVIGGCASSGGSSDSSGDARARKGAQQNTQLAAEYIKRGEYEVALDKLNKALAFDPDYASAHSVMGTLYNVLGENEKSGRHYKRAAELEPNKGEYQNAYGTWLCRNGQQKEGIEHFEASLKDPFYTDRAPVLANAGTCAYDSGDLKSAEQYFRKALEYADNFPEALYYLAEIQYANGKYMPARGFLQRYEGVGPLNADALMLGYNIETQLGDRRSAEQYGQEIQRRFPDSDQARQIEGRQ